MTYDDESTRLLGKDLLAQLQQLPSLDLPTPLRDRTLRLALKEFRAAHQRTRHDWLDLARVAWRRALEPAFLTAVSASWLAWAVLTVIEVRGG